MNVVHFCVIVVICHSGVVVVSLRGEVGCAVDWEGIVKYDVVNRIFFYFVFFLVQVVCV